MSARMAELSGALVVVVGGALDWVSVLLRGVEVVTVAREEVAVLKVLEVA